MEPKFKVGATERLFVSDKYICNGHWMFAREVAASSVAPKPLRNLTIVAPGAYQHGIKGFAQGRLPDMEGIIPKRDGYRPLALEPIGVTFGRDHSIRSYKFETKAIGDREPVTVLVDPKYVPLLELGHCFVKDSLAPILILSGETLNDDLVGLVMPMRQ